MSLPTWELAECIPGGGPEALAYLIKAAAESLPLGMVYELRMAIPGPSRSIGTAWYVSDEIPCEPLFLDRSGAGYRDDAEGVMIVGRLRVGEELPGAEKPE